MQSPPSAMVTLDKMLALSQTVDWLGLMDIGQLGPAVRYFYFQCIRNVIDTAVDKGEKMPGAYFSQDIAFDK